MAFVAFKKGLLANLPAAISEGTIYVTTDERAMYLDVDSTTRVRIGDFQEFATLDDLQANTNPSTTALYYVSALNALAKWDGTQYVQINLDTGATSAAATGSGNALDGVSYDPATRKLTFTKTKTFTTASDVDTQIASKIGTLTLGEETFDTVKAYVDKKTDGIATDAALETLTQRVTTAEGKLDTLNGDKTVAGSVDKKIDDAIAALDLDNAYDPKGAADAKDAAIAAAKKAGDDAQAGVDALEAQIGTVAEGKTVVQMISDAQSAATYDDTALAGRVSTLEGSDAGKSARVISAEEATKAINTFATQVSDDGVVNSFKELVDWAASHGSEAAEMAAAIQAIQAVLAGIGGEGEKATVVAYVTDAIAALQIGDYAKAADLTALAARVTTLEGKAHEHANKTVLDGITAAKVTAWDAAEQNAKDYADGLAGNYDAAGAANTALTSAKAYADGLADNYDAAGAADTALTSAKAYTDTAVTWGSF